MEDFEKKGRQDEGNLNYIFDGEEGKRQSIPPDEIYKEDVHHRAPFSYPAPPRISRFSKVFVSAMLAVVMFVSGFLLAWYAVPSEEEKLARFIKDVADKYFYDVDGSGFSFIQNMGTAMAKSLDEYSSFYSGDSLQNLFREREGKFNDTGMVLQVIGGECIVLKVYGGSPSHEAGIRAGDVLEKVNDFVTAWKTLAEIREEISKVQASGQDLVYTFRRYLGEQIQEFTVTNLKSAEYTPVFSYYFDSGDIAALPSDAAYITLEEFSYGADEQFKQNLEKFKEEGKKDLILDLRTNFGGSLNILQNIASYLISDGISNQNVLLTVAEYKDKSTQRYYTTGNYYSQYFGQDSRIVVLANGHSASATEVLICAMKDYGTIHKLVGEPTFGKAVMQAYFEYQKKFGIYVTVALLYSPVSNQTYNKTADKNYGFMPDEQVPYQKAGQPQYDPQFMKAVELLGAQQPVEI